MTRFTSIFSKGRWKPSACFSKTELTSQIAKWLLFPGSFTHKIQSLGTKKDNFVIKVLRERLELSKKNSYEAQVFNCNYVYSREVQIFFANKLVMYAKSVMPKDTRLIFKQRFRGLNQRPLGQILFSSVNICRGAFDILKVKPYHFEYSLADSHNLSSYLWARRSTFSAEKNLILLYEILSPDLIKLIKQYDAVSPEDKKS